MNKYHKPVLEQMLWISPMKQYYEQVSQTSTMNQYQEPEIEPVLEKVPGTSNRESSLNQH
jgi:hypothetical protein